MNAELLWSMLVKGSFVLVLATLASLLLRRSSASRRHTVWLAALMALLLLPFAAVRLPSWSVPREHAPLIVSILTPPVPAPPAQLAAPSPGGLSRGEPSGEGRSAPRPTSATLASAAFDLQSRFVELWFAGLIGLMVWFGYGLVRVFLLVRSGRPFDRAPMAFSPAYREGLGSMGDCRILFCPRLRIPATTGWLRPVILLPEGAANWDAARLRMVIAHETAHIRRRDWVWQVLSQIACALHFFNPLAWWAARKLRAESEFACDDFVLAQGIEPTAYAQELLQIASLSRFQMASSIGMARSKNVEGRLRSIVDGAVNRKWVSGRAFVGVLAISALIVAPVAVIRAVPGGVIHLGGKQARNHVKLPPIPSVNSKESTPGVYLADNGVAELPNGIKVRLVGVQGPSDNIWGLDGKSLPDEDKWRVGGIYWQGNVFRRSSSIITPIAAFGRGMIVELESKDDVSTAMTSALVAPVPVTELQKLNPVYAGGDDRAPDVELLAGDPTYAILNIGIPARSETGVYRVGVANGEWKTEADINSPYDAEGGIAEPGDDGRPQCGISLEAEPTMYWSDGQGSHHGKMLLGGKTLSPDLARRILLYDRNGQLLQQPSPAYDTHGYPLITFRAEPFTHIARIVLQTSPYIWAEFRDVPLRPDFAKEEARRLDPGIHGTAKGIAPGFSKKLANGVTVSIASVTRAIRDHDNWKFMAQPSWRADGLLLAKPAQNSDFPRPVGIWGQYPLVDFEVAYAGLPKEGNTIVKALGKIDPSFWLNGDDARDWTGPQSLTTAFLPEATSAGLRVGVANGPWTTVASCKIDIPEEPAIVANENDRVGRPSTGIRLTLNDAQGMAKLTYLESDRTDTLLDKPLSGAVARYVVVLRTGEIRPLQFGSLGRNGLEVFYIPARHGEDTEGYNSLIAGQVKEIRLQTRPYEYIEFHNISLNHR